MLEDPQELLCWLNKKDEKSYQLQHVGVVEIDLTYLKTLRRREAEGSEIELIEDLFGPLLAALLENSLGHLFQLFDGLRGQAERLHALVDQLQGVRGLEKGNDRQCDSENEDEHHVDYARQQENRICNKKCFVIYLKARRLQRREIEQTNHGGQTDDKSRKRSG